MMSLNEMFYPKTEEVWIINTDPEREEPSEDPYGDHFDEVPSTDSDDREQSKDSVTALEEEEEDEDESNDSKHDEAEESNDSNHDEDEESNHSIHDSQKEEQSKDEADPDSDSASAESDDQLRGMPYDPYFYWTPSEADGAGPQDSNETTYVFRVPMCCASSCEERVAIALRQMSGVRSVECNWYREKVTVAGTAASDDLLLELRRLFPKSAMWNDSQ